MSIVEWQYCNCDDNEQEELVCGCGQPHLFLTQQRAIHWRENHWSWECAFNLLLEENDDMRKRLVKMAVDKIFKKRRNLLKDYNLQEDDE